MTPTPAVPVQTVTVALAFEPTALAANQAQAAADLAEIELVVKNSPDGLYPIADTVTHGAIVEYLREKLREFDAIETMRKAATAPLNLTKKTIDGWFAPAKEHLTALTGILRRSLEAYALRQIHVQNAARAEVTTALTAGAPHAEVVTALAVANTAPTKAAGFSVQAHWVAEVIAEDLLDRQWLKPDLDRLQLHADGFGSHQTPFPVPGVRFVLGTSSRAARK